jgi:hypothetical protein
MSRFGRSGHWRTNANGTTFYVREHMVYRDHWDIDALRQNHFGHSVYYASDFLRRNNVGRGKQGCFVNPNAKCPVCSMPVFFYSNSYGSKVYFDDLGPPWPKHPCTDNPTRHIADDNFWGAISKRPKGLTLELIEKANIAGLLHKKELGQRRIGDWTLLLVDEVIRDQNKNILKTIFLDSGTGEKKQITCFSDEPHFKDHDLLAWNGTYFSFILRGKLTEAIFHEGGFVETKEKNNSQSTIEQTVSSRFDINHFSLDKWNETEIRYFRSKKSSSVSDYISKYRSVFLRYIEEGLSTPEQFALALGKAHFRTAVGGQWTPQLAEFLVYFIFNGTSEVRTKIERDLTEDEMHNFHTRKNPIHKFVQFMNIKLKSANKSGKYSDAAISNYFNSKHIFTASGGRWSLHLIRHLKMLIRHEEMNYKNITDVSFDSSKTKTTEISSTDKKISTYSPSEIEEKLSKIGVVKRKR